MRRTGISTIGLLLTLSACYSPRSVQLREPAQAKDPALSYMDKTTKNWLDGVSNGDRKCISCHTTLPYAMIRPKHGSSAESTRLRKVVEKRVNLYKTKGFVAEVDAWYEDYREQSLSNEVVMNALTLIYLDLGKKDSLDALSAETRSALNIMWQRQDKGGFAWLDVFDLKPFEAKGAAEWGAAMVAIAVAKLPAAYHKEVATNLKSLRAHLKSRFSKLNLHNRLSIVWAHQTLGGILTESQVKAVLSEVKGLVNKDGGLSIMKLISASGKKASPSDGYATALTAIVLLHSGEGKSATVTNAVNWIKENQKTQNQKILPYDTSDAGSWFGMSPNHEEQSLFFTDLSTSYAMLALHEYQKITKKN